MTIIDQFEASLAAFYCWQQAAHIGDTQSMVAIGSVLRNRASKEGKSLLELLEEADAFDPHLERVVSFPAAEGTRLRLFLHDFNEMWEGYGEDATNGASYWYETGRAPSEWMAQNVLAQPEDHPRVAQVGRLIFLK